MGEVLQMFQMAFRQLVSEDQLGTFPKLFSTSAQTPTTVKSMKPNY